MPPAEFRSASGSTGRSVEGRGTIVRAATAQNRGAARHGSHRHVADTPAANKGTRYGGVRAHGAGTGRPSGG
jgi:hypothetical protein